MRYSEDILQSWVSPLSKTEEQRVENTINMIKTAVRNYNQLNDFDIEIFAQGSYANNTNVRQNSDIDICVMLKSSFFCNYLDGKTDVDYGYIISELTYSQYRSYIIEAINEKFGTSSFKIKNKSINISSNSYHVNADVVPAFQYRDFKSINSIVPSKYIEGIKFFATDNTEVINYPKFHIDNGKRKNIDTNYYYKKLVRIMKHIRNDMVVGHMINGEKISSFLIECLTWNVPNDIIMNNLTWEETIKETIIYLWNILKDNKCVNLREVSGYLYLFDSSRKWTISETQCFLKDMYNYLEF